MNIHKNARLTPLRREEMALCVIEGRLSRCEASHLFGVTTKIVRRREERYLLEGRAGMTDRSSRPKTNPKATKPEVAEQILSAPSAPDIP
jgi:hypothetical protein